MAHSEDGKDTFEILQSVRMSTEYLKAVQQDIIYPDAVISDCTETDSEDGTFTSIKVYSCGDRDAVKEAYKTALLEKGFLEMQQYPEGFSVFFAGGSVRICRGFGRRNVLSCDPRRKCIGGNYSNCDTGG